MRSTPCYCYLLLSLGSISSRRGILRCNVDGGVFSFLDSFGVPLSIREDPLLLYCGEFCGDEAGCVIFLSARDPPLYFGPLDD